MNWHYQNGEQLNGPISESTLRELHSCGIVSKDTQVREEGGESWMRYEDAFAAKDHSKASFEVERVGDLIKFYCPKCNAKISAGQDDAGSVASCPSCSSNLVVPRWMSAKSVTPNLRIVKNPANTSSKSAKKSNGQLVTVITLLALLAAAIFVSPRFLGGELGDRRIDSSSSLDFTDPNSMAAVFGSAVSIDDIQERNKDGANLYFLPNSDLPFTGWIKKEPGHLKNNSLLHVTGGRLDGTWVKYFSNEQLQYKGLYKLGEKSGMQESWYENGQKESEIMFAEMGVLTVKRWKPNGQLCLETQVSGGNGKAVSYADNGIPRSISIYENGKGTVRFLGN
jgi:DNA-directed RNA polymerase subunit RPC12/RpoP